MILDIFQCDVCKGEMNPRTGQAVRHSFWRVIRVIEETNMRLVESTMHACKEDCFHALTNRLYGDAKSFTVTTMDQELDNGK